MGQCVGRRGDGWMGGWVGVCGLVGVVSASQVLVKRSENTTIFYLEVHLTVSPSSASVPLKRWQRLMRLNNNDDSNNVHTEGGDKGANPSKRMPVGRQHCVLYIRQAKHGDTAKRAQPTVAQVTTQSTPPPASIAQREGPATGSCAVLFRLPCPPLAPPAC